MKIIFHLPEDKAFAELLANQSKMDLGQIEVRNFPDGESYVRILSDVKDKTIYLVCGLDHPDNKILPLYFIAKTLKEIGAKEICLVTPYLPYMRQDKRFKEGEAISAELFANFISTFVDRLITIDPHLHRIQSLEEIYNVATLTLHATDEIAKWIKENVSDPIIIGPDEESKQWVAAIANHLNTEFVISKKIRHGDSKVSISLPELKTTNQTPVLVDDIISTGSSMIAVTKEIISRGFKHPICITVHPLFNDHVYQKILYAGAMKIVSCNTIPHTTNEIDVSQLIAKNWG